MQRLSCHLGIPAGKSRPGRSGISHCCLPTTTKHQSHRSIAFPTITDNGKFAHQLLSAAVDTAAVAIVVSKRHASTALLLVDGRSVCTPHDSPNFFVQHSHNIRSARLFFSLLKPKATPFPLISISFSR